MIVKHVYGLIMSIMGCLADFNSVADLEARNGFTVVPVMQGLNGTRTILFDRSNGDLITIARGLQQIVAIWETFAFSGEFQKSVIVDASSESLNLTHGLAIRGNYIYASSDVNLWRWPYKSGVRSPINVKSRELVVTNMGAGGRGGAPQGHTTRSFVFGPDGYLYIGISSLNNVDQNSARSRVRRIYFPNDTLPALEGFDFENAQVWADGLRNPLGLDFDTQGQLWEMDNGPDDLIRDDLGDIHPDNPCEELNLLNGPANSFYGYPYCFSIGNLTQPFGNDPDMLKQLAWPSFLNDTVHTDEWCQDRNKNRPPVACAPAHSSPIMMQFYKPEHGCNATRRSFSCSMQGDAFMTLHGSWDRPVPVGYSVLRIPFDKTTSLPTKELDYIFKVKDYESKCTSGGNVNYKCFRPAGLAFKDGIMYVSSDSTGEIVRVLTGNPEDVKRNPSGNSSQRVKGSLGLFGLFVLLILV